MRTPETLNFRAGALPKAENFDDSILTPHSDHTNVTVHELDAIMVNFEGTAVEAKHNNVNSVNESAVASSDEHPNRTSEDDARQEDGNQKKRQRDRKQPSGRLVKRRHYSISKAARDPRDEASPTEPEPGVRSPSPVIDFDGLSRPSKSFNSVHSSRSVFNMVYKVVEPVNDSMKPQNKPLSDSPSFLALYVQFSNASAKIQIDKDC